MSVSRKHYASQFKTQVVLDLLAGEQTLSQFASKYSIHPYVITKWRKAALEAMPDAFDEQTQKAVNALKAQHEKELLYTQIGRLTTRLDWLEKS